MSASEQEPAAENWGRAERDAVCFTPGFEGLFFGAGVIHAYLTADQKPPLIVAGLSLGALNAAAMQRAFAELERARAEHSADAPKVEACRWAWFRRYVNSLCDKPVSVLWKAIPDTSDFVADHPPVIDTSPSPIPTLLGRNAKRAEQCARRSLYLVVRLGIWLSRMPIPVSQFARTAVRYVRFKEQYPGPRSWRRFLYYVSSSALLLRLWVHFLSPRWFPEYKFWSSPPVHADMFRVLRPKYHNSWAEALRAAREPRDMGQGAPTRHHPPLGSWRHLVPRFRAPFRPLFGWQAWLMAMVPLLFLSLLPLLTSVQWLIDDAADFWAQAVPSTKSLIDAVHNTYHSAKLFLDRIPAILWIELVAAMVALILSYASVRHLLTMSLHGVGMHRAILDDYHLNLALAKLFCEGSYEPRIKAPIDGQGSHPSPSTPHLIVVAAPLQMVGHAAGDTRPDDPPRPLGNQLWAGENTSLLEALRAALALPGFYSPWRVRGGDVGNWTGPESAPTQRLDLVDASVIRENPLPALISYLRRNAVRAAKSDEPHLAAMLTSTEEHPAIHVVYSTPVHDSTSLEENVRRSSNIVDIAFTSLALSRRRDIRMEIRQLTEFSRIQSAIETDPPLRDECRRSSDPLFPLFADEIAPEEEIRFATRLRPERQEALRHIAHGCRKTLEVTHREAIKNFRRVPPRRRPKKGAESPEVVDCPRFLAAHPTTGTRLRAAGFPLLPGMPEVCRECTQKLRVHQPDKPAYETDPPGYISRRPPDKRFPMLTREDYHPRLILVASGGVFRGTFHAGMSAALWQMRIAPNLIAGASVGTLLGAVYGAMITATCPHEASDLLRDLCLKFLNVDSTVALTHTLKNAAREIGLRARSIHLSPLSLRRHVRAGTRSDPGYAATGAPPELIDAISELFLIPHQATRRIAARFIAGHITDAVRLTFEQFKKETLKRLDIEVALLTTSLLSAAAQDLLRSVPRSSSQPFASCGIAFLATTTNFATRWPHLLGYSDCPSYDFLNAALASGAFPAAFEPVPESSVYPGLGNPNSPYSDGGMFDNLPFLPALFALQKAEAAHWSQVHNFGKWRRVLRMKLACPDLFLAGSLDANPEATADTFEDLLSIYERADMLKNNIKIQAFETLADIFARQGGLLLRKAQPTDEDKKLAISLPCVPVLPIYPTDAEHLNGTFHFCASTGMDRSRIGRSIADGCFQTFHAFQARQAGLTIADAREQFQALLSTEAENEHLKEMSPRRRSILGLLGSRKTPLVQLRDPYKPGPLRDGTCPFFVLADNSGDQPGAPRAFPCPFVAVRDTLDVNGKAVRAIYVQCCADKGHAKTRSQASIATQT